MRVVVVHLHSVSESLFFFPDMEEVSSGFLASLMLLRRNDPCPWPLGPRLRKGLPWVIRAPRFSSSPYIRSYGKKRIVASFSFFHLGTGQYLIAPNN